MPIFLIIFLKLYLNEDVTTFSQKCGEKQDSSFKVVPHLSFLKPFQ